MYRYTMTLNDEPAICYFTDHSEASNFLAECDKFGDTVIVHGYEEVSAEDIKADKTLSHAAMVEYLAMALLPNWKTFKKWAYAEAELKRLGHLT